MNPLRWLALVAMIAGQATGSQEPVLPTWDGAERGELEASGWLPGGLLLTDEPPPELAAEATAPEPLALAQPSAGDIEGDATPPYEIPETYWPAYFSERPAGFLVDPQQLLGPLETRDRLGFLNYHASDSAIDLYVYLFKGDQEIPGEVREEELVERVFSAGRPAAVVYYFMGAPQRSVLYLSPSLTDAVSAAEQRRALESSVMQAFKDVDPARQLEGFLVQMSIRVYWMERMHLATSAPAAVTVATVRAAKTGVVPQERWKKYQPLLDQARQYLAPAGAVLALLVTAWMTAAWIKRRKRHFFPEFDVEPRLGGAHAAGVGAVISFASAALPPASQRDQVPDYLRRM